jgi:3-dehydroquinate synthase
MGAGKTVLGREVAHRLDRPFIDLDEEIERRVGRISEFFERFGEVPFRHVEATTLAPLLDSGRPAVIALGGGAVTTPDVRDLLRSRALTVFLDVDAAEAWRRAAGTDRPLAPDETSFRALYEERRPLYEESADARAQDADGVVLAAAAVHVETGSHDRLGDLVPGDGRIALVADAHVAGIYGPAVQLALASRLQSTHELPAGEEAKTVASCERLWRELGLDRRGTIVALGGGCTTDAAGFVAATFLRGVPWVAVPTTLVGQVDAAVGGKTGINLPEGKNLVGAFHQPLAVVADVATLATLSARDRRAGLGEVAKYGFIADPAVLELLESAPAAAVAGAPDTLTELVRRGVAAKAGIVAADEREAGDRALLNYGHTVGHAIETLTAYDSYRHGEAVALGMVFAARLGERLGVSERGLADRTVALLAGLGLPTGGLRLDPAELWKVLERDKKATGSGVRFVLCETPGRARLVDEPERRLVDEILRSLA